MRLKLICLPATGALPPPCIPLPSASDPGHSFEEANISRWLSTHDTCPVTGTVLSNKRTVTNFNLRDTIQHWAQQHGLHMRARRALVAPPSTSSYHAVAQVEVPVTSLLAATGDFPQTVTNEGAYAGGAAALLLPGEGTGGMGDSELLKGRSSCLRCTRTRWAWLLIMLIVIGGAAAAVGATFGMRSKGKPVETLVDKGIAVNSTAIVNGTTSVNGTAVNRGNGRVACTVHGSVRDWQVDDSVYCLFSPALAWQAAEKVCRSLGKVSVGWTHMWP